MSNFAVERKWDIFCKIVDNFGDIGVCWRLAQQLHLEHGLHIRLWVDDLTAAQKIIPSLAVTKNQQRIDGITITKWHDEADFSNVADVVIEAFACGLPKAYLSQLALNNALQKKSKWVNVEYLSAETWVADFHATPSPQANGLTRYFYFPGFTEDTGGLIRESNCTASSAIDSLNTCNSSNNNLKVSLFCYPHAQISDLLTTLSTSQNAVDCYVPASSILPNIAAFFGKTSLNANETLQHNQLNLHVLPFLSQIDYDQLLKACDLNFVRGEDSWLRAIWAGKPFIWQPYLQDENAHITKLNAFLALFYADFNEKQLVCEAHGYWSLVNKHPCALQAYLNALPSIKNYTQQQAKLLANQTDLATKLVDFCNTI